MITGSSQDPGSLKLKATKEEIRDAIEATGPSRDSLPLRLTLPISHPPLTRKPLNQQQTSKIPPRLTTRQTLSTGAFNGSLQIAPFVKNNGTITNSEPLPVIFTKTSPTVATFRILKLPSPITSHRLILPQSFEQQTSPYVLDHNHNMQSFSAQPTNKLKPIFGIYKKG